MANRAPIGSLASSGAATSASAGAPTSGQASVLATSGAGPGGEITMSTDIQNS